MDDVWKILQIEPTSDKGAIVKAYRKLLVVTHPEDKPEEFKALRAAYEKALSLAQKAQTEKTPAELWTQQIETVYLNIEQRSSVSRWEELLREPFCLGLDTRMEAESSLLQFLLTHVFLPGCIWRLLDSHFGWTSNMEELRKYYPEGFLQNVLAEGVRNDDLLPYEAFQPGSGEQYDAFLKAYGQFCNETSKQHTEQMQACIQEMEASGAEHPYLLLAKAKLLMQEANSGEEYAQAAQAADALLEKLPQDAEAMLLRGNICVREKDYSGAEPYYRAILEKKPRFAQVRYNLAECLMNQEKYEQAKEILLKLDEDVDNNLVKKLLEKANLQSIPLLETKVREEPENHEVAFRLCWCYLQSKRLSDVQALVETELQAEQGTMEYENLAGKLAFMQKEYTAALLHLRAWAAGLEALPEGDEEKSRLPNAYELQAETLFALQQNEEGSGVLDALLLRWPDFSLALKLRIRRQIEAHQFTEALRGCRELEKKHPEIRFAMHQRGRILFHMERYPEAYSVFEKKMRRFGKDTNSMLFQCRILLETNHKKEARKIVEELQQSGLNHPVLEVCRARLLAGTAQGDREARQVLRTLLQNEMLKPDNPKMLAEIYYTIAKLEQERRVCDVVLPFVEKGLELTPDNIKLLYLQADLLERQGSYDNALAVWNKVAASYPEDTNAYNRMGVIQQQKLNRPRDAAESYRSQLLRKDSAEVRYHLGQCLMRLDLMEEAGDNLHFAVQSQPDNPEYRLCLGQYCAAMRQNNEAESHYRIVLQTEGVWQSLRDRAERQLAYLYLRQNRPEEALELQKKRCAAGASAHLDCILLMARMQEYDAAREMLQQWRKLPDTQQAEALAVEAELCLLEGNLTEALRKIRSAAQEDTFYLPRLAKVLLYQGNDREAADYLQQQLKLHPSDSSAWENLATAYWLMGDEPNAEKAAQRALDLLQADRSQCPETAMYYSRLAMNAISMNRFSEAEAALSKAEKAPVCESCTYDRCKDVDIFRGMLLLRQKRYREAAAAFRAGWERDHDDADWLYFGKRAEKRTEQL